MKNSIATMSLALAASLLIGCATRSETDAAERALVRVATLGKTGTEAEALFKGIKDETPTTRAARRRTECESIGKVIICVSGNSVCWWGPKKGYGCSIR